jgi:uncharacterized phage protein (TIGR01671 family)
VREIKFRAWDKEKKRMSTMYGFSLGIQGNITADYGNVLMQYTGLHDKNGTEIFEGDIVVDKENGELLQVKWNRGAWECWKCEYDDYIDLLFELNNYIEVIGNIYQNPELLEVR